MFGNYRSVWPYALPSHAKTPWYFWGMPIIVIPMLFASLAWNMLPGK